MTAVSVSSRLTGPPARGSAAATSCSNSPGTTGWNCVPAALAPSSASAAKSCQLNSSFAPESDR